MPPDFDDVVWLLDDDEIDIDLDDLDDLDIEPNVIVHPALGAFCLVDREPVAKPEAVVVDRRDIEIAITILNEEKRRARARP